MNLSGMAFLGEHRGQHVRQIVRVDEGLRRLACREGDLTGQHPVEHRTLAEVLREEARPHHRQADARLPQRLLGGHGVRLAAAGEQHHPPHPAFRRQPAEGPHRLGSAGRGEVGGRNRLPWSAVRVV
jgi:hypothetical protein